MFTGNSLELHSCKACNSVVPVAPGLALSASEVAAMAEAGKPVTTAADSSGYYDGDTTAGMEVPPEFRRGYDINDAWNDQASARSNIRKGRQASKLKSKVEAAEQTLNGDGSL